MKFTSLLFWVQENRLSAKFYKRIGFEIVRNEDDHSIVSIPGLEITLVNMRDEEKFSKDSMSSEKGRGIYVYVRVDDVDATYDSFVSKGVVPSSKPKDWDWGKREFIQKDPDGYKLCFWHPID